MCWPTSASPAPQNADPAVGWKKKKMEECAGALEVEWRRFSAG